MNTKRARQKTFDKVAKHLLLQNEQAFIDPIQGCAYRTESGLRCAIGCLIPDRLYNEDLEGYAAGSPTIGAVLPDYAQKCGPMFLLGLQKIHDKNLPAAWPDRLIDFAHRYGLDPKVVYEYREDTTHA